MKPVRILHLSDVHASSSNASAMAERIRALSAALQRENLLPDIVVFTGDAANKGKVSEYSIFHDKIVSPLLTSLGITSERFVIVPGNHDVDRDRIDALAQAGLTHFISKPEEMDDLWRKDHRQKLLLRMQSFYDFVTKNNYVSKSTVIEVNGVSVGFACLNSAWLSASDQDKWQIAITRAQIEDAYQIIENADLRIALWHHPLTWLHESDAARVKSQMFQKFEICLTGHLHDDDGSTVIAPDGRSQLFTCPALHAKGEQAGAMSYEVDISTRTFIVHAFRWNDKKATFVRNTDFADAGRWEVKLLGNDELSERAIAVRRRASTSRHNEFSARLSRLLPPVVIGRKELTIEERFIDPHLVIETRPKEKKVKIQDIINDKASFVVSAFPQAGKTALLDRIGIKLNELGIVAIALEFADLKTIATGRKALIDFMSDKLNCTKADSRSLLEGQVTMLVDNCKLKYDLPEWLTMKSWLSEVPTLRIIAAGRFTTLPQTRESMVGVWKFLSLRPLTVSLVKKEVSRLERIGKEQFHTSSNLHSTLSTLIDAELPRWPWVILLLFELAQRFRVSDVRNIEGVLRKYSDLRLGAFDAAGTERPAVRARMLRILATEMINNRIKHLPYDQVVEIIEKESVTCGVEVKGSELVRELLDSQLLTNEDEGVTFTFFILQEFFHAEYLKETLWSDVSQLDLDTLIKKSGALILFAEMVKLPELLKRCLELSHTVKGVASVSNLIDSLANLRLSSDDANTTIEKANAAILPEDEAEDFISAQERTQNGTRESRALRETQSMHQLEQFIHSFATSIAVMRGSRWLDKELKRESISQGLDFAISIVAEIAADEQLLRAIANQELEPARRREVIAVVNAVLVLVVANMLAVLGAGQHLTTSLRDAYYQEKDDIKRLMLVMWYAEVGGAELEVIVEDLVRQASHAFTVRLATFWLYSRYVMTNSFGGSSKSSAEHLLRIAATEQTRRYSSVRRPDEKDIYPMIGVSTSTKIKAEAEKIIQNAKRDRLIHNPED